MGMNAGQTSQGRGNTVLSEINVTPLVDVMLVLLVIFMVTAPMIDRRAKDKRKVDMDLPVTKENPNRIDPAETEKLILEITEDLKVRVGDTTLVDCGDKKAGTAPERFEPCFAQIAQKLSQNMKLQQQGELYLLADTEIPYGFVVGTMARVKQAGVKTLGMVTNPEYLDKNK